MTGKERIFKAFHCESVDRTPWVPFVGCHGAALLGITATEYLQSDTNIVAGISEAIRRYQPDGICVMFDLQVEAEALGCELVWADDNPPAVTSHPLAAGKTMQDLHIPQPDEGRLPVVIQATRQLRQKFPDLAQYGLITGPFTLGLHLAGTELFMKMFDDPGYVHSLMKFGQQICIAITDYYLDAGADIIALVDPMTSQIGPDDFRNFVTPYARPVFDHIRQKKALGSFFVCGHAQQNIEAMCECRPDNVSIDENIALDYVRDVCLERGISFGGNLKLTATLLLGSQTDVQRETLQCLELAGEKGFILAPGCDLPYATPPENLEVIYPVVSDPYQREIIRTMAVSETAQQLLDMHQYGQIDKVVVDIITLDSESCAPCQYMVESVRQVAPEFEGIVEWREHKIKHKESLTFMTSLMVRNIPTICIDGQIRFVSRIPPRNELVEAIQQRINEKLKLKIQSKRAIIYVLGAGCEACATVKANVERALQELGSGILMKVVQDEEAIRSFGVKRTPAVIIERKQIKSMGTVPSVEVIKEWIKDI